MYGSDITPHDILVWFPDLKENEIRKYPRTGQKQVFNCACEGQNMILKFIHVGSSNGLHIDDAADGRVKQEVSVMELIDSDYIPKLGSIPMQYVEAEGEKFFCYSEEFLDGPSVAELIRDNTSFDYNTLVLLTLHVTYAISCLWQNGNRVHRDIKPGNIVYDRKLERFVLIDIGISISPSDPSRTPTGQVFGTLPYMSPEQLEPANKRKLDHRSDLYSMALVVFQCATQQSLEQIYGVRDLRNELELAKQIKYHQVEELSKYHPELPWEFTIVIDRLLKKRPHQRFKTCESLLDQIESLVDDRIQVCF